MLTEGDELEPQITDSRFAASLPYLPTIKYAKTPSRTCFFELQKHASWTVFFNMQIRTRHGLTHELETAKH